MVKGKYNRTKETREKMSKSHKGKKCSEETKKKIGKSNKGKIRSEESKRNLSRKLRGRHNNPQTEFKKGQKAWNFEGKEKSKRLMKKWHGKLMLNSHYVFCRFHNLDAIPKGYIIHHKDRNAMNDDVSNLVLMTRSEHSKLHNKISKINLGKDLI